MKYNKKFLSPQKRLKESDYDRIQELYDIGKNDREISEEIGCSSSTIQNFRLSRGLPCQRDVIRHVHRLNGLDRARIEMLRLGFSSYYEYMEFKARKEAGA